MLDNHLDGSQWPMPDGIEGLRILGACDNYTPESSGGAEKAAHEIYRRLARAGAQIWVIGSPFGSPHVDDGVEVVPIKGLDLSRLAGGYFAVTPRAFTVARALQERIRPEALHANTIHYNACAALARRSATTGVPLTLTAQVGPMDAMPLVTRMSSAAYDRTVGRYIVRRSRCVLAVSEAVREHVVRMGAVPERVRVVENGVDHARFASDPLTPNDRPTIVSVGRLLPNKGPDLLLDAAIELARDGFTFRIEFLGDGPMRRDLEARADTAGVSNIVTFRGHVTGVERELRSCDIVVRPSYSEGLPLAVLEAMSAGRCNVVSDIPPNRELITHEVNGLVFRTGDPHDLALQLRRAIKDVDLRLELATAARSASLERSWDRMAAETAEALLAARGARC